MKWVKLIRESGRWVYGSRTTDQPPPKGIGYSSERRGEQHSIERIAVDGKIVVERDAYHGQDRGLAFAEAQRLAEEHRIKNRKRK